MRCPKCHYISFDDSERCRNCGYEFSLAVDAAVLDLPIHADEHALGPLADFALTDLDGPSAAPEVEAAHAEFAPEPSSPERAEPAAESAPARRAVADLPLFKDRALDDDAPLVTPPAVPRMPLAVRRSNPALSRAQRTAAEEPELALEPADEPAHEAPMVPPPPRAAEDAGLAHAAAGIGPRILAGLVDLAILGGIDAAVLHFTLKICGFSRSELFLLPMGPLTAFLLLLNGGYFVAFVAAGGQTIGKMAAGIKVIPAETDTCWSDRVPLGTAFVRAAASLVSLAPAGAGLLPALLAADRRAVHDRLAHTRVVKA